jgi:hypothetical protein
MPACTVLHAPMHAGFHADAQCIASVLHAGCICTGHMCTWHTADHPAPHLTTQYPMQHAVCTVAAAVLRCGCGMLYCSVLQHLYCLHVPYHHWALHALMPVSQHASRAHACSFRAASALGPASVPLRYASCVRACGGGDITDHAALLPEHVHADSQGPKGPTRHSMQACCCHSCSPDQHPYCSVPHAAACVKRAQSVCVSVR